MSACETQHLSILSILHMDQTTTVFGCEVNVGLSLAAHCAVCHSDIQMEPRAFLCFSIRLFEV